MRCRSTLATGDAVWSAAAAATGAADAVTDIKRSCLMEGERRMTLVMLGDDVFRMSEIK